MRRFEIADPPEMRFIIKGISYRLRFSIPRRMVRDDLNVARVHETNCVAARQWCARQDLETARLKPHQYCTHCIDRHSIKPCDLVDGARC